MAGDYGTPEARAFHEHYDKLVKSIQEPDLPVLGARFFSRHIITLEVMEMLGNVTISRAARSSKLMLAVMANLDTQPDKFKSALDVFREDHTYAHISSMIEATQGQYMLTQQYCASIVYSLVCIKCRTYVVHALMIEVIRACIASYIGCCYRSVSFKRSCVARRCFL